MRRRMFLSIIAASLAEAGLLASDRNPKPVCANPKPVAPPLKFTGGGPVYNPDHKCPACGFESPQGRGSWVQSRDVGDRHEHTCPKCGKVWWHFDDGHEPALGVPTYVLPQASGCANGNCPTTTTTRFRRR